MTAEEFLEEYAARSGYTPKYFLENRRRVIPCDCDYEDCHGWQLTWIDPPEWDEQILGRESEE